MVLKRFGGRLLRLLFYKLKILQMSNEMVNLNVRIPEGYSGIEKLRLRIGVKLKLHKILRVKDFRI